MPHGKCTHQSKTFDHSVGAGVPDRPAARCLVHAFARAQSKNVGSPARDVEGAVPYDRQERLRIMIHLYRVAGLRADEGIGSCDDAGAFPSVGAATSRPRRKTERFIILFGRIRENYEFAQHFFTLSISQRGRIISAPTT